MSTWNHYLQIIIKYSTKIILFDMQKRWHQIKRDIKSNIKKTNKTPIKHHLLLLLLLLQLITQLYMYTI